LFQSAHEAVPPARHAARSTMSGIFICYRREDAAGWAGRLQSDLQDALPNVHVFRDVEALAPGVRFEDAIEQAVGSCDVLIALIGPQWLSATDKAGQRRLDDPDDLVRLEIATCLQRDVRVIPALVGGARLPHAVDLPEAIRSLVERQSYELSDSRWKSDCRTLTAQLRPLVRATVPLRENAPLVAAGFLALLLAGVGIWYWGESASSNGAQAESSRAAIDRTSMAPAGTEGVRAGLQEAEPNDDILHPNALALAGSIDAHIKPITDKDFFAITAPSGDSPVTLRAVLHNRSRRLQASLTVWDDAFEQVTSNYSVGGDVYLSFPARPGPRYYVESGFIAVNISPWEVRQYEADPGAYRLTVVAAR
jgi:hypothetical protein